MVSNLMVAQPPKAVGAAAEYPFSVKLQQKFVMLSRFGEAVPLYKIRTGSIYLPRAVCPEPHPSNDNRTRGTPVSFACTATPRNDEQAMVTEETVEFLEAGLSGIVQASTGFGKTVIGMMVAARLGLPTLIVVTKEDLLKQWVEAVEKFLGLDRQTGYGIIQGDTCDVAGKPVGIAMIHSIAKEGRYPDHAYRQWGLMIVDECHRVAADQFSSVCHLVIARLRLGLSATVERQDGKEFVLYAHIGPIRVRTKILSMLPKVLVYTSDWECPRVIRKMADGSKKVIPMPHTPGKTGHLLKLLANHARRQQLLCELTYTAWTRQRKTIFFSDSLDHLDQTHSALYKMGVPQKDIGFYKGGMKKGDLDKSKAKPVILATYGFAKEGTDIPWLDCAVMGTPKAEVEQIIGRVVGEYPNKPQPVVFDVQDLDSSVFAGYAQKRIAFYQHVGADIKFM